MFFKKDKNESSNLSKVAALLIHAAKIDENFSKNEETIIKQALLQIGANNENLEKIFLDGKKIEDLTFTEFQILHLLGSHPGWVFTRYQIIDKIRGDNYPVTDRSVDFQIVGLRKKMGKKGKLINTIRGVGYRFQPNET